MKTKHSLPPQWADKLLSWFCKEEALESIQGDLHEVHQKRVAMFGRHKATLLYLRDVLSVMRPRLIKKSEGTRSLNHYGIFKNYLTTSIRSIKHSALFSGINVVGLAISMSVGILMIVLLSELRSFDNFHEKKDRIYRVTTSRKALLQGEADFFATAPHYIADQLEGQVSGVEQILVLDRGLTADLKTGDRGIAIKGYYASASFFDVLSFKLKKGNPETVLENPGAIVLTESAAKKLFGDSDPMNKTIAVENNPDFQIGMITGIVADPPANSHLDFEALVSMKTMDNSLVEGRRNRRNPAHYAQSYVYLVLKDGASAADIEASMTNMMAAYNSQAAPNTLSLQPMEEFVIRDAGLPPGPIFSKKKIDMMMGLTLIVLLSACFNYTNLSLVRGLRRSKEICVRKIAGAKRLHVFSQFMTEAALLSLLALTVSIGLFFLIKPEFLKLPYLNTGNRIIFLLGIGPVQLFYFLFFAIIVGGIAGFFPALILSKLKASALFNDASKIKFFSGVSARQTLITCQMALSIGLIMCAVMTHKQYEYALNYDLGYDTENIVNITLHGDYGDVLENEYAKMSDVAGTSRSSVILGTRNLMPADAMSEDHGDTIMFSCNYIDSKYLDMHGFRLVAGTGFINDLTREKSQNTIIVNEQFLKALKVGSPEEAIGKYIWYFGEERLKIQGVVGDFISMSLDAEAPEAFGFLNRSADGNGSLGVKIATDNLLATMQALEKTYKKMDPVHPFEATFYDDQIAKTYEDSKTTFTIISFLAFLAISISTLGLLGVAVFTIETRMKEICIRKILGAGITNLMLLLSRSFLVMITIAAAIAIPVTLYIVDDLILNEFLYRIETGRMETLSGLAIVLLIGVLTVGWQVRRAAVQNPADLLRDE
jgi:putative ABC transport system permease protein